MTPHEIPKNRNEANFLGTLLEIIPNKVEIHKIMENGKILKNQPLRLILKTQPTKLPKFFLSVEKRGIKVQEPASLYTSVVEMLIFDF